METKKSNKDWLCLKASSFITKWRFGQIAQELLCFDEKWRTHFQNKTKSIGSELQSCGRHQSRFVFMIIRIDAASTGRCLYQRQRVFCAPETELLRKVQASKAEYRRNKKPYS